MTVKKLNGLSLVGGFAPKELKVEFLRQAGVSTPEKLWEGRRLWWGQLEGEVEGEANLDLATCQATLDLPVGRETWLRFANQGWIPWFQANEIPLEIPLEDLSELLTDRDWEIRVSAAQSLSAQARSLPERELLVSILQDEDWRVKGTAAECLAPHAGDPAVQRGLLEFLMDKERLAERLAECPDEEEIVDEEGCLRWQAAKALSGHQLVADVREALEVAVREDEALRWHAAKALTIPTDDARSQDGIEHELGKRSALAELSRLAEDPASRKLLIEAMSDHSLGFEVRTAAAKSVAAHINDLEVQRSLIELLTDPDWKMRGVAGGVFGAHPLEPQIQKKIASFLVMGGTTRIAVAAALGGGPLDPEVQQALLGLLEDENSQVRLAAIKSLARWTADPAVQRGIAPLLKDKHLRAAAAKVLSGHPLDPEVQRSLIELLTDPDRLVRAAAAKSLAAHPLDPAVEVELAGLVKAPR